MKTIRQILGCVALGAVLAAVSVDAQTLVQSGTGISVNINGGAGSTIASDLSAGKVPLTNWNNTSVTGGSSNGANKVLDSSGAETGLKYSISAPGGSFSSGLGGFASSTGDNILFSSVLNSYTEWRGTTITLSGISYANYDLYVYINREATKWGARFSGNLTVSGTTIYYNGLSNNNSWQTSTALTAGEATPANYILFSNLTSSSLTMVNLNTDYSNGGISGFQLVELVPTQVPEPSTLALLGGGVLLLALARKLRKKS